MATTIETFGVIDFYAISGARGLDRPEDILRMPWTGILLAVGATGHGFLRFHKYERRIVRDGDREISNDVTDIENYYIGFHPTGDSPVSGCGGHTRDNRQYMEAIQRTRGTTEDYSGNWYFARTEEQWNAAVNRANVWNARNYYKLIDCDCTTYVLDVAGQIGLRVPVRTTIYNPLPYQAIDALIAINATYYRGPMATRTTD